MQHCEGLETVPRVAWPCPHRLTARLAGPAAPIDSRSGAAGFGPVRRRIQSGNGRKFACCDFIQTKADSHAKTAGLSPSGPDGPRPHDAARRDGLGTGMRGHVFRACLARCWRVLHRAPLIESVLPSRYPITILSDAQRQHGEWGPKLAHKQRSPSLYTTPKRQASRPNGVYQRPALRLLADLPRPRPR